MVKIKHVKRVKKIIMYQSGDTINLVFVVFIAKITNNILTEDINLNALHARKNVLILLRESLQEENIALEGA